MRHSNAAAAYIALGNRHREVYEIAGFVAAGAT